VKTEDKTSFAVDNEPDVMLDAFDRNDGFIGVPLVGMEIHRGNELNSDVVEQGCEFLTPVSDGNVRDFDIIHHSQDHSNISGRTMSNKRHSQDREDEKRRVTHSFEIMLADQSRH